MGGFSKKLKDHENGISHQTCCSQWMLLAEGIRNSSTIDKREMNIFFNERRFWRNVLERLIDIALFLSERNLAFRGSEEVLGSPHNGNFLGIFELLARRDPILKELQDRIKNKNTKDHYLSPTIQNELIELLATEVEKENLQQLKLAKYFSIILDCTPDMSHHEQMSVILRYVLCNEEAAVVKETFYGYLRISDSTGKGLLDAFLEKATELKFKSNFFYPLVDQAMMSIKERFNLLREVSSAFSFLYTRDKLLLVQQENALLTCCKEFQKKFGDIDSDEMSAELQRFVLILQNKRNLNTAQDFLNYLLKTHLFELYPNVYIALRILLTCPVTVASAERSFSKLKLIKTFNRTSMTDSRLSSLAMLSIENDCARSLDYDNVITAFANKKVRSRLFK